MRSIMIVSGRLAADPVPHIFEESQKLIAKSAVFVDPAYLRDKSIPLRISAWEDLAKHLCKFKKGDMIHCLALFRHGLYKINDSKFIDIAEANVRAFISENQVHDLKKSIFEIVTGFDDVCSDFSNSAIADDRIYFTL